MTKARMHLWREDVTPHTARTYCGRIVGRAFTSKMLGGPICQRCRNVYARRLAAIPLITRAPKGGRDEC